MCRLDQAIEIGHAPKQGIHINVICDIIAEVCHGGGKDWRQPNGVNSELNQIWQSFNNTLDVTYAIPITVLK
jgi:hypothetical protein